MNAICEGGNIKEQMHILCESAHPHVPLSHWTLRKFKDKSFKNFITSTTEI